MWNKDLKELEKYVGTKTLLHVKVDDYRFYEDLFITCEHLYEQVNGEKADATLIRHQAYNIIRSVYNTIEDGIYDLYANLEDAYRPQYSSRINSKHTDYKVIEFNDYCLPIIDKIKSLIDSNKVIEIVSKTDFQGLKLRKILDFIGLKNRYEKDTKYPAYIIDKESYFDKYVENISKDIDNTYSYNSLEDKGFDDYHKR